MRVVVVGGGVVGLSCALALRQRGWDVLLVEADVIGGGASRGNAGWITPSLSGPVPAPGAVAQTLKWIGRATSPVYLAPRPDPALLSWLIRFSRHCSRTHYERGLAATAELARGAFAAYDDLSASGVEFESHRDGLLFAYLTERDLEHHLAELALYKPFGYSIPEVARGHEITELEPSLGDDVRAAVLIGQERHVRPETICSGLADALVRAGGKLVENAEVTAVRTDGRRRVVAVETCSGDWAADAAVVSTGVALGRLLKQHGIRLAMQAGKGYSIDFTPPPVQLRRPTYLHEARVALSPFVGTLRVAGTMELSGVNTRVLPKRAASLTLSGRRYLPMLPDSPDSTRAWVGMRPMLPDGLPVIGKVPNTSGLYVAGGHAMLGVTLGPATGKLVAEMVHTGRTPAVLAPFQLDRAS